MENSENFLFEHAVEAMAAEPENINTRNVGNKAMPDINDDDLVIKPHFFSKWGGFWTDLDNAAELLDGQKRIGRLSEETAERVTFWIENGYVIIPQAVPENWIDAALTDIDACLNGIGPERFATWWSAEGHNQGIARAEIMSNIEAKLLDMHAISTAVQQMIFSPKIVDFLNTISLRPMISFQSLTFKYGSQQPIHQDTAFVRTNSPMEFIASWIALEDIQPGSGALEYYPRSHRLPEILYRHGSKWLVPGEDGFEGYSEHLHARAAQHGLKSESFYAKKGDVLLWSADLAHGGLPITQPGQTRQSIVTHYCPLDRRPIYALKRGDAPPTKVADGRGYSLSLT